MGLFKKRTSGKALTEGMAGSGHELAPFLRDMGPAGKASFIESLDDVLRMNADHEWETMLRMGIRQEAREKPGSFGEKYNRAYLEILGPEYEARFGKSVSAIRTEVARER